MHAVDKIRRYEVYADTPDGKQWLSVPWERLQKGDLVRQFEPGSNMFSEFTIETDPFLIVEGGNQHVHAPLNMFADDPEADGTDAAHPAWWRGHDTSVAMLVHVINEILDGKDNGVGVMAEPLESLRRRLIALAKNRNVAA